MPDRDISSDASIRVSFDAEYTLVGEQVPERIDHSRLGQAVQDALGYSGLVVVRVFDWEESSGGTHA